MAGQYDGIVATARRMIAANGRACIFSKRSTVPADPTKPMRGPAPNSDTVVPGVMCCFVSPGGTTALGARKSLEGDFAQADQVCLIAPDGEHDFTGYEFVEDDGTSYRITVSDMLKPGDEPLLYFVGMSR